MSDLLKRLDALDMPQSAWPVMPDGTPIARLAAARIRELEAVTQMKWQPIETAPKDVENPILLACIIDGVQFWTAQARWGTVMPGYVQCASYSGWFPDMPNLCDPSKGYHRYSSPLILGDVISEKAYPPTHWMPLPEPPAQENADE